MRVHLDFFRIYFFRILEKIKNKNLNLFFRKYEPLVPWLGVNYIHLVPRKKGMKVKLQRYYSKVRGDIDAVNFISEEKISYDDHLPRIRTLGTQIESATFINPTLTCNDPIIFSFKPVSFKDSLDINKIATQNPHLAEAPKPFNYSEMESGASLNKPVNIGLPEELNNFSFNNNHQLSVNVLHLPIKVSKQKAIELRNQGRIAFGGSDIDQNYVYIPKDLAYITPLIEYISAIEQMYNPYFIDDYYIFITVSNSIVPTHSMQRRGGWHIDGHQGYERVQYNGQKLPCDRQYLMSNILPTESFQNQFDFSEVRAYCKRKFCHIDSVNMQDVIEFEVTKALSNNTGKISVMDPNQLYFMHPYMVHKAQINTGAPTERTFLRILVSTFKRDRLGDTVNPILGPLWRYKVKTITDIHEMDRSYARS
jgi:hypothetical protein